MATTAFHCLAMSEIAGAPAETIERWLWDGYLAAGSVTLFTSQWKTGKTTLLTGLLRALERGEPFLGRAVRPGHALVVSEESRAQWAERLATMPVGPNSHLLPRPFRGRPTVAEWNDLIDEACRRRFDGKLDLFVIDPLASFLPGRCESDAGTLIEMLQPLHRLADGGAAVLLLHHPRKKPSEPGSSARGSGALLGFVDIVLELTRYGRLRSDSHRRQILGQSRKPGTPERLAYEWNPSTGLFAAIADPRATQFEDNWEQVKRILECRSTAATHRELLEDWPGDSERPGATQFYAWLNLATAMGRVERRGNGTRLKPWKYSLNRPDEMTDLPELPPLFGSNRRTR